MQTHALNHVHFKMRIKLSEMNSLLVYMQTSALRHIQPAHLNHFPDAVNTIGQQTLHAPVIIHVISMPDAHE